MTLPCSGVPNRSASISLRVYQMLLFSSAFTLRGSKTPKPDGDERQEARGFTVGVQGGIWGKELYLLHRDRLGLYMGALPPVENFSNLTKSAHFSVCFTG